MKGMAGHTYRLHVAQDIYTESIGGQPAQRMKNGIIMPFTIWDGKMGLEYK